MFSHSYHRSVEWGDCDPAGIVFYPRFFAMFDEATGCLLEAASGYGRAELMRRFCIVGWPMAETRSSFLNPVSFGEGIRITSQVTKVGTSSFSISHQLYRADLLCVEAHDTRVWCARSEENGKMVPTPLPAALRDRLLSFQKPAVGAMGAPDQGD